MITKINKKIRPVLGGGKCHREAPARGGGQWAGWRLSVGCSGGRGMSGVGEAATKWTARGMARAKALG